MMCANAELPWHTPNPRSRGDDRSQRNRSRRPPATPRRKQRKNGSTACTARRCCRRASIRAHSSKKRARMEGFRCRLHERTSRSAVGYRNSHRGAVKFYNVLFYACEPPITLFMTMSAACLHTTRARPLGSGRRPIAEGAEGAGAPGVAPPPAAFARSRCDAPTRSISRLGRDVETRRGVLRRRHPFRHLRERSSALAAPPRARSPCASRLALTTTSPSPWPRTRSTAA